MERASADEIRAVERLLSEASERARKSGNVEDWRRVDRLEDKLDELQRRGWIP